MDDSSTQDTNVAKLQRAVRTLRRFAEMAIEDDRDRSGIIQAFEFTFELTWKVLQEIVAQEGQPERGTSSVFTAGIRLEIIAPEEDATIRALIKDRNWAVHTYDEYWIVGLTERILRDHVATLESLAARLIERATQPPLPEGT